MSKGIYAGTRVAGQDSARTHTFVATTISPYRWAMIRIAGITPANRWRRGDRALNWLSLLDRIGAQSTGANLDTLVHLQRQALLTLPFENLDIHLGRPIHLDPEAAYLKIIAGDRGQLRRDV